MGQAISPARRDVFLAALKRRRGIDQQVWRHRAQPTRWRPKNQTKARLASGGRRFPLERESAQYEAGTTTRQRRSAQQDQTAERLKRLQALMLALRRDLAEKGS
jgi:hypothetical protein